jgi:hypothetical protein
MREKASNVWATELKSANDDEKRIDVDESECTMFKAPYASGLNEIINEVVGSRSQPHLHSQRTQSKTKHVADIDFS